MAKRGACRINIYLSQKNIIFTVRGFFFRPKLSAFVKGNLRIIPFRNKNGTAMDLMRHVR
jgi:hypothetical protein